METWQTTLWWNIHVEKRLGLSGNEPFWFNDIVSLPCHPKSAGRGSKWVDWCLPLVVSQSEERSVLNGNGYPACWWMDRQNVVILGTHYMNKTFRPPCFRGQIVGVHNTQEEIVAVVVVQSWFEDLRESQALIWVLFFGPLCYFRPVHDLFCLLSLCPHCKWPFTLAAAMQRRVVIRSSLLPERKIFL